MKKIKSIVFLLTILICSINLSGCSNNQSAEKEMWISSYDEIINEVAEEVFSVDDTYSHHYIIYDIDKNDTPELFIKRGRSEAEYIYQIYSFSEENKKAELLDEISAFHVGAVFGSKSEKNQFYTSATHMGILMINKHLLTSGKINTQKIFEGELTDDLELDYMNDAISLEWYALDDKTVFGENAE